MIFYLIVSICCQKQNQIKLRTHDEMMKYLYSQNLDFNASKIPSVYYSNISEYYCVGDKFNRCQHVSQNKVTLNHLISETDVNEILLESYASFITFYITKSVDIRLNILCLYEKNVSFIADSAVKSSILFTVDIDQWPDDNETAEETTTESVDEEISNSEDDNLETQTSNSEDNAIYEGSSTGEESLYETATSEEESSATTIDSSSESNEEQGNDGTAKLLSVISTERLRKKIPNFQIDQFNLKQLSLSGVLLGTDFDNDIDFCISNLDLHDSCILEKVNKHGNVIVDNLKTDFTTIVQSENSSQTFFQKIRNLTIDGVNIMTTIHFEENYKFRISNVGTFLDQEYDINYGTVPQAEYLYFITNRRLDLEADYQMPVVQPHYSKSGVFLSSRYPYIQFSQSKIGLWTEEAQLSIDIFMYEGRRLTLSGNFNKMNTTYYEIDDDFKDSNQIYELNDRDLVPIIGSCVSVTVVFFVLYYLTIGRTVRKYNILESDKNIKKIDPNERPTVIPEKLQKKMKKMKKAHLQTYD